MHNLLTQLDPCEVGKVSFYICDRLGWDGKLSTWPNIRTPSFNEFDKQVVNQEVSSFTYQTINPWVFENVPWIGSKIVYNPRLKKKKKNQLVH